MLRRTVQLQVASGGKQIQLVTELPKYPFKVDKTARVCVIQLREATMLITVSHLSLPLFSHERLSWP